MFSYSDLDFRLAERFSAVVLGTDKFYQEHALLSNSESEPFLQNEGLVPVNLTTVKAADINSWEEAIFALEELYQEYRRESNPVRRNYMWQQIRSFINVCKWLSGEKMSFRDKVRNTQFISENPVGKACFDSFRQQLFTLLGENGYSGNIDERLEAWRQNRLVSGDKEVEDCLNDFISIAQQKTFDLGLSAVADYQIRAEVVHDMPYNAYCDFVGRVISINGDTEYTEEELKHLVCHEAFPGHVAHLAVRADLLKKGAVPADAGLVLTNTASSPIFEGIADNGDRFIRWDETNDDRICYLFNCIQTIGAHNAAHMLNAEGKSTVEVYDYLRDQAFGSDGWIEARFRFMNFPFRVPFIYAYWCGWSGVRAIWNNLSQENKPIFIEYLYNNMHSLDSANQFYDYLSLLKA